MRGVSTAFWSVLLCGSAVAIGAGFVGGRSIGTAQALPAATDIPLPAPIRQHTATRALAGAHSFEGSDLVDPYGRPELGVVDRPAAAGYDPRKGGAKLAVIAVGAASGPAFRRFLEMPVPLALAVAPGDEGAEATVAAIARAGKVALAEASAAEPAKVAALVRAGAVGVIGSLPAERSRRLMRALDPSALVVDAVLDEDDGLAAAARKAGRTVLVRDAIADARDDRAYVDFMLRTALGIAERNGRAIVALHAREESLDAIARLADRARRNGIDLVSVTDI